MKIAIAITALAMTACANSPRLDQGGGEARIACTVGGPPRALVVFQLGDSLGVSAGVAREDAEAICPKR